MAQIRTTSTRGYVRFDSMFGGSEEMTTTERPNEGVDTSTWANNGNLAWTSKGGNVCSSSAGNGFTYQGSNGKSHDGITHIGTQSGSYPSTEIDGFRFQAYQNSGAGHGLYIRRWGFRLATATGSGGTFFDCGGVLKRGDYGTKTYSHKFNSSIMSKLANGYVFDELRIGISTDGGTGTRDTCVQIYNFEFSWAGISGRHMIIPAVRPYAERHRMAIA